MPETTPRSPAQPAVVLGLTFLLIGLTFALPHLLVPQSERKAVSEFLSPETANVYACVAWAGWAHFIFAFRGQGGALAKIQDTLRGGRIIAYIICVLATIAVLLGLRSLVGVSLFGAVTWVYFIDHFIKAEQAFEGGQNNATPVVRWLSSYQPLLTFGWLSVVLLNIGHIDSFSWLLWSVSLVLAGIVLAFGGWRKLTNGDARGPLLSLFFIGEALVWGAFSRYGGPMFLFGVYVFHIAAGSYFHYLGSYFVANARNKLHPLTVLAANILIIAIGYLVANQEGLKFLRPVLGLEWFTLWVALHLVTSDLFPMIKSWRRTTSPQTL